ncbi:GTP cyclohydrolase 1 [Hyphomicrobium sp. 1Nfss2.1]|uniref:GTP cyclohydrolase I FolE n=1 Tax=Hyphomicrobium sp. 1Nfss2.1 TaxID=3413936 RepID=UPI003C7C179D
MTNASGPKLHSAKPVRPSRDEAEQAVRTLLAWLGDDPSRPGLANTPKRVAASFEERFRGYREDPAAELARTYEDLSGYADMVLLRDIRLESYCEHHIAPFTGVAHVAYLPNRRVVGLSKLARIVDIFARRLQVQESLTAQIGETIQSGLEPLGVAVLIRATHQCMTLSEVNQPGAVMETSHFTGVFRDEDRWRRRFLDAIGSPTPA